jgi:hypothetical protein
MMTWGPVTVRIWGGTVQVEPSDPDGTEAAIAAYLSSVNVASESAAPFARSAAGLISLYEFEFCGECGQDLGMHEIGPDMFGLAHAWCLKCGECGHPSANAGEAIGHLESHEREG